MKKIICLLVLTLATTTFAQGPNGTGDTGSAGTDCKINVYKPDSLNQGEIAVAEAIKKILIQKGYKPVEDDSAKLTHNANKTGFAELDCSSNKWGMAKIKATATISFENFDNVIDSKTESDNQTSTECATLDKAMIKATMKLKTCSEL